MEENETLKVIALKMVTKCYKVRLIVPATTESRPAPSEGGSPAAQSPQNPFFLLYLHITQPHHFNKLAEAGQTFR